MQAAALPTSPAATWSTRTNFAWKSLAPGGRTSQVPRVRVLNFRWCGIRCCAVRRAYKVLEMAVVRKLHRLHTMTTSSQARNVQVRGLDLWRTYVKLVQYQPLCGVV